MLAVNKMWLYLAEGDSLRGFVDCDEGANAVLAVGIHWERFRYASIETTKQASVLQSAWLHHDYTIFKGYT